MKKRLFTQEQEAYFKEIVPGRLLNEIADLMFEKFGIVLSNSQVKNCKGRLKVKSGVKAKYIPKNRLTTPEQNDWIREHAYGKTREEIHDMIKDNFGLDLTPSQLKSFRSRNKILNGLDGRFKPSHIPANKGKKMSPEVYERCKATMFRPGNNPNNYRPVGSERVNVDGYIEIKVAEPNKWDLKHRVVYRQHHGEIPKGGNIIFADGNRLNVDINNLLLTTDAELARMNQNKLFFRNIEATKTGLNVAKLLDALGKQQRRLKDASKNKIGRRRSNAVKEN